MIFEEVLNTNPMPFGVLATKKDANAIQLDPETPVIDFNFCDPACCFKERVFADPGGEYYKNDKSSFLFRLFTASDAIVFKLFKNGVEVATISDDTYGELFEPGDLAAQPLYAGLLICWENVFNIHSYGQFELVVELNRFGVDETITSRTFCLYPYSDEMADGTVRIESIQNGCIESSVFDYTDLEWYQSIRIPGKFFDKQPELIIDNYFNDTRTKVQTQDSITNEYRLETKLIPSEIANVLIYDYLLANTITVTDSNLFNFEIYRNLNVRPTSIDEAKYFEANRLGKFQFIFSDRKDNILKRNVK